MAASRNQSDEPFFWIKTGHKAGLPPEPISAQPTKSRLSEKPAAETQPPRVLSNPASDSARAGLQQGWTRATFIIREEYLARLKDRAYWDRKAIKEVLDDILGAGLSGNDAAEYPDKTKRAKK
jgi:hypothetical protein